MAKPSLIDLEAFTVVAAERSFRRAADRLGVSRSALSHRMSKLEEQLDLRLLNRTTRSVSPTEAGRKLLSRIGPTLRDLDTALDTLAEDRGSPSGVLRINAGKDAARLLLRHAVPAYLTRYSGVELDLVSEGRLVDIVELGFDAGIRLSEAVPQDMIAVRISRDLRFLTVAAPEYVSRFGKPGIPDDLLSHRCIRQRLPSGRRYRWQFEKQGQEIVIDPPGVLTLDDNDLMVEAAADGLGIVYVPETAATDLLAEGRLMEVLEDWCPPFPGLMLYYPANRRVPSALRALIDLIKEPGIRDALVSGQG